jgi:hypothetical protein
MKFLTSLLLVIFIAGLLFGALPFIATPPVPAEPTELPIEPPKPDLNEQALQEFLTQVARFESNNQYSKVSRSGMLGKYQFSIRTLRQLGYSGSADAFLEDEELQEYMMVRLLQENRTALGRAVTRHDGVWRDGVYISKSGLLAGAHLVGVGGVLSYLYPERFSYPTTDGNGVHVSEHIARFSGHVFALPNP